MNNKKIIELIKLLQSLLKKEKPLKLEDHNFRVNSDGWKKFTKDDVEYLESPEGDIWELLNTEAKGEQLFTWDAAMRETKKAGKRMPTDEEFDELLKTKEDIPNFILAGSRSRGGSFYGQGSYALLWSSSKSGTNAWIRYLHSSYSTVYRYANGKAYGFSVRCLQE